jgi:hypothetical protein
MVTTRLATVSMLTASFLFAACGEENVATEDVATVQSAVIGTDTFLYFRSNATGWGVDDSTRLITNAGGVFFKRIDVTQAWMLGTNDTATVTETNQLNGWGTAQTFYDLANTQVVLIRSTHPLAVSPPGGDPHFQVDYTELGAHQLQVNTNVSPFTISILDAGFACLSVSCPGGLHCEVAANGLPTCVLDHVGPTSPEAQDA